MKRPVVVLSTAFIACVRRSNKTNCSHSGVLRYEEAAEHFVELVPSGADDHSNVARRDCDHIAASGRLRWNDDVALGGEVECGRLHNVRDEPAANVPLS